MFNFTTDLKLNYLDDFMNKLDFYDTNTQGLKKETTSHYKDTLGKSASLTSKIVNQLMAMWVYGGTPYDGAKRKIVILTKFALRHITCSIPLEIHRVMLILTFPLFAEIMQIIATFGDGIFTNDMIVTQVRGDYGAETTKEEAVKKALMTMCNIGIIKRYKKGIYQINHWPVFNVLGIATVLCGAQAMAETYPTSANPILKGLSLSIDHEFIEYFARIDYAAIVGKELWEKFKTTDASYTLQFQDNQWSISNLPFVYKGLNITLDQIPANVRLSTQELKGYYLKVQTEKNLNQDTGESKPSHEC